MRGKIIKSRPKYWLAVIFAISFLMMIGTCSSTNAASLNVDNHSKTEIINRIKTNPVSVYDVHTFATEPRKNDIRGELSDSSKQDALKMLNNIRYVAGLNDVVLDGNHGSLAQAATFVDWVIGELTHYPGKMIIIEDGVQKQVDRAKPEGMSDVDWEDGKTGAAKTNIAYNFDTLNAAVLGWTEDDDKNNINVIGHRRWTLNPTMGKVGFGAAGPYYAEYSFDQSGNGTQTNVAWPARYMPVQYFGKNIPWSLSTGSTVNKNNVQVVLERSSDSPSGYKKWNFGGTQTYTPADTGEYFNVDNQGYGQKGCIIFRPDGIDEYKAGDKFNVRITGAGSEEIAYNVEFFDPYLVSSMSFSKDTYTMNDSSITVKPSILPKEAKSYQVSYSSSNENVATVDESGVVTKVGMGETTITATISGEYTENGSPLSASYTLKVPKDITDDDVTIETESTVDYTGKKAEPKVTILHNGKELEEGKDYEVSIPDDAILPKLNGSTYYGYSGTVTGKGDYKGQSSFYFWIYKKDLSSCDIVLEPSKTEYSGELQKPTVKVLNGDLVMSEGLDYVITRNDGGTNVGSYTVWVSAAPESKGYQRSGTTTFEITKKNLTADMVEDIPDETFNGENHDPEPVVKNGEFTLIKDKDYTLSYENNIDAGTAKVIITGQGNYQGSIEKEFTINKKPLSEDMVSLDKTSFEYTGINQAPIVTVSDGSILEERNYTITNEGGIEVGLYSITISAKESGNYVGIITKQFSITPKALTADMVDIGSETFTYNGKNQKPNSVTVKNGELTLEEGTDYTLTNGGGTDAGTYKVTVTANEGGNYSGSAEKEYVIDKKELSADMVSLGKTEFDYNGSVQKPEVTVSDKVDGDELISNDDYEITNDGGTNAGEYKVTVTAKEGGNYKDPQQQIEQSYTIKTKSLKSEDITVSAIDDTIYNGSEQEPKPVVKDGETTLVEGTDYELSYSNNKNVGTAKVTITGKGNYQNSVEKTFTINKKALTADMVELSASEMGYTGTLQKPGVTVSDGDALKESDYTITNKGGTERGTYDVVVAASDDGNYTGEVTKQFSITPKTLTADMVDIGSETFTYNGKNQKPNSVTVKNGELTLEEGTDYTLTNEGGTNAGTYKVIVTAKEGGNYSGAVIKEYTIKEDKPIDNPINDPTDDPNGGKPDENPVQPGQTPGNTPDPGSGNTEQPTDQKGADGTALGQGASAEAAEAAITGMKSDKDPAGSAFGKLQLRSTKQTRNSIKLAWKKVGGAVKYVVYGNQCGIKNKMKKIREVSSASFNVKNIEGKKLKKGTSYKFILVAIDRNNKVVSSSKVIHVFTAGGKNGNHKKVIVKAKVGKKLKAVKKLTIKVRKKVKLKTQLVLAKKKLKVKKHAAVRFESDKPKIAVVSKAGVVKGLKKGKCTIFAYAQNGVYAKIKVTVK